MKIRILPRAGADAQAAHDRYEEEHPGLGERFERELGQTLDRIEDFPAAHPKVVDDVRRALFRRFPYGVFYTLWPDDADATEAVVLRILHLSRHPDHWKG